MAAKRRQIRKPEGAPGSRVLVMAPVYPAGVLHSITCGAANFRGRTGASRIRKVNAVPCPFGERAGEAPLQEAPSLPQCLHVLDDVHDLVV